MKMSSQGRELLMQWEGFKLKLYKDSKGLPTIGVGHLLTPNERRSGNLNIGGKPVSYRKGLTAEQVSALLEQDLPHYEQAVNAKVVVALEQNQFDALVSFCFNVGPKAFQDSTLVNALNAGRYADVPDEFRRWTKAGDQPVPGLVNRRENEIKLWMGII